MKDIRQEIAEKAMNTVFPKNEPIFYDEKTVDIWDNCTWENLLVKEYYGGVLPEGHAITNRYVLNFGKYSLFVTVFNDNYLSILIMDSTENW